MKEGTPSKSTRRTRAFIAVGLAGSVGLAALAACGDDDCAATSTCEGTSADASAVDGGARIRDGASDAASNTDAAAAPHVVLRMPDATVFVVQGAFVDVPLTIERTNYDGRITLSVIGLTESLSAAPVEVPAGATTASVRIAATDDRAQGNVGAVSIVGAAEAASVDDAKVSLFVRGPSGSVDTTFGGGLIVSTLDHPTDGSSHGHVDSTFDYALSAPGGRVIAMALGDDTARVVRYERDGGLDTSFGGDASVALPADSPTHRARMLYSAAGELLVVTGTRIYSLSTDGGRNPNWADGGGADTVGCTQAYELGAYAEGGVPILECCPDDPALTISRLTSSGTKDPDFGPYPLRFERLGNQSPFYQRGAALTVTPTGSVIGYISAPDASVSTGWLASLYQMESAGHFDHMAKFAAHKEDLIVTARAPDGSIIAAVGAAVRSPEIALHPIELRRFTPDLASDPAFGSGGSAHAFKGEPTSVVVLSDGSIMVAGVLPNTDDSKATASVQRFHADGSLDNAYGKNGIATISLGSAELNSLPVVTGAFLQADGSVLVVGGTIDTDLDLGFPQPSRILRLWQ